MKSKMTIIDSEVFMKKEYCFEDFSKEEKIIILSLEKELSQNLVARKTDRQKLKKI